MEFIQVQSSAKIQIQSYENHTLMINGMAYHKSLIALPDNLIEDWSAENITSLTCEQCEIFLSLKPAVLLLGTGAKLIFPSAEILTWFRRHHIGVEYMDTAAACRTFQVLTSENRRVVAGLLV